MTLVVRADASAERGTGHVMRCFALAQAWQPGEVLWLHARGEGAVAHHAPANVRAVELDVAPGSRQDAAATRAAAAQADWLVLDGYQFKPDYQRAVAGGRVLVIDDHACTPARHGTLVLDQNLDADARAYPLPALAGPDYALLRPAFRNTPARARAGRRVLVSLGGNAALDTWQAVLDGVARAAVEATAVTGSTQRHVEEVHAIARAHGMTIAHDADMASWMAWADAAVVAGGTTCLEACASGLPCVCVALADNQRPVQQRLVKAEVAVAAAIDAAAIDAALTAVLATQKERSQRAGRLVDGLGAPRVASVLRRALVTLRAVTSEDARLVWDWANDPATRRASFHPEAIAWEEHKAWWQAKTGDAAEWLRLAVHDDPLAFVRVRTMGDHGVLSIHVGPDHRGRGWGPAVLRAAVDAFHAAHGLPVHAYVKPDNAASLRAFRVAGFQAAGERQVDGQAAVLFTHSGGGLV